MYKMCLLYPIGTGHILHGLLAGLSGKWNIYKRVLSICLDWLSLQGLRPCLVEILEPVVDWNLELFLPIISPVPLSVPIAAPVPSPLETPAGPRAEINPC